MFSDLEWHHSSEVRAIHPHYNWTTVQLRAAGFEFERRSKYWRLIDNANLDHYLRKWYHPEVDAVPMSRWLT